MFGEDQNTTAPQMHQQPTSNIEEPPHQMREIEKMMMLNNGTNPEMNKDT